MSAPKCRQCGKQLAKLTWNTEHPLGTDPQTLIGQHPDGQVSLGIIQEIVRVRESAWGSLRISVWCGDYGRRGDGLFCTLSCGYRWAVNQIRNRGT